jgi:DNA polymerase-3 subunit gamma/tau
MAYEVTATRLRPKTFDELAGQEFVVSTLKNSLQSGQIAHAYLFSGPRGCGKTSAARILARSLNCEKGLKDGPCGGEDVCDNCRAIISGASMDVLEIDGASNRGIDDVRQIKDEVLFPPQAGRYKIYIIDEVHMLTKEAFNALLKTIEEPPPYIVFIFATTEVHKVPATIKSRCQQFNFRFIPVETIKNILRKACDDMGITAEDDALFWIAKESTGSMREAFTTFDQVLAFSEGKIRSDLIREKFGITGLEKLNALAEACAVNDAPKSFALTDEILASGVAIEQFIIDMAGYYRSLLLLKNGVTRESILGYPPAEYSAKVLETYDSIRLEQALEILLDCYRDIRYSLSPRFEIETAVSKLTWLTRWISPVELKTAIDNARLSLNPSGSNPGGANASANPNPPAQSNTFGYTRPQQPPSQNDKPRPAPAAPPPPKPSSGGERSLSNEFQRMLAARGSGGEANDAEDDDDVPVWDSAIRGAGDNSSAGDDGSAGGEESPPSDGVSQVDRVLSMFPSTVVK